MEKAMEKLLLSFVAVLFIQQITAEDVIYQLEPEDYYRMPLKNNYDRFDQCVGRQEGVYCTANADLVADQPNELLHMIRAYSAHHTKHFNYSNIFYGLCITNTCSQFYNGDDSDPALWNTTEACLNHTLSREYGLKTRVYDLYCVRHGQTLEADSFDQFVAMVIIAILALNLLGTIYDVFIRDQSKPGNSILMSFAFGPNWQRMLAPASTDPRQVQLRSINGLRVLTAILVILGHVPIPSVIGAENPPWFESAYRILPYHILFQGHLITLTFFVVSGFLLTYNLMIQSEKRHIDWKILPKAVLIRWLRLTPASAMILMLTASWMRFAAPGPLWKVGIGNEFEDCRNYWIFNALYINNLIDYSTCNLQMWSLASDMQLHVVGLAVVLLAPSKRARNLMLVGLYLIGILWPAYHIYTKDLDGSLLGTPGTISTFFLSSDAFNYVYKRTYSNLPCFVMGMGFGYYVYDLQKRDAIKGDHSKWRYVYWSAFGALLGLILAAYFLFFQDAPRASMVTRLLFAPIIKPLFGACVMMFIIGAMYRVEGLYRGVLEWEGWVPMSRISYCMYVVHVAIVRYLGGTRTTLTHLSLFHMMQEYTGTVFLTIIFAMILHLTVEAPFAGIVRVFLMPPAKPAKTENGQANGHAAKSQASNGHATNGHATNSHATNGHATNGFAVNGRAKKD